jgi:hypothetical protein
LHYGDYRIRRSQVNSNNLAHAGESSTGAPDGAWQPQGCKSRADGSGRWNGRLISATGAILQLEYDFVKLFDSAVYLTVINILIAVYEANL